MKDTDKITNLLKIPVKILYRIGSFIYLIILMIMGCYSVYNFLFKSWNDITLFDYLGTFGMAFVVIGLVGNIYKKTNMA